MAIENATNMFEGHISGSLSLSQALSFQDRYSPVSKPGGNFLCLYHIA